mmetsp:Transcript_20543/g.65807  ORF Transcript_20543/g.65807 Transcript_20543/m.65807 type:complete len:318 (-) Transcript_20543:405-1358(-)
MTITMKPLSRMDICERDPMSLLTAERPKAPATGKHCIMEPITFATPAATSSWSGSTLYWWRSAYDLTTAACSMNATNPTKTALTTTEERCLEGGMEGVGSEEGMLPTTSTPTPARSATSTCVVALVVALSTTSYSGSIAPSSALYHTSMAPTASTSSTSGAGTRFTRGHFMPANFMATRKASEKSASATVFPLASSSSVTMSYTLTMGMDRLGACTPSMSLTMDRMVMTAAALAKPLSTGREIKLSRNPSRSNPMDRYTAPTIMAISVATPTLSDSLSRSSPSMVAPTSRAGTDMGPIAACLLVPNSPYMIAGTMAE